MKRSGAISFSAARSVRSHEPPAERDTQPRTCDTNLPEPEPELRFLPEKKMQQFRSITGAVEGVMLPPRVVQIDDEGRAVPPR